MGLVCGVYYKMTLYLIGIGLDENDLTLKALEAIKECKEIYLDNYTSVGSDVEKLEKLFNKKILLADRDLLENNSKSLIEKAKKDNIGLLVYGDCLSATTHISLLQEAKELNVKVEVIHGVSILTSISETGLNLYNFGKVASIPFENKDVKIAYDILKQNKRLGMHTLLLLDLNPKDKKFLTIKEGLDYLLRNGLDKGEKVIGCSRLGRKDRFIKFGEIDKIKDVDFGKEPYCIIVPGKLHFIEEEYLLNFK